MKFGIRTPSLTKRISARTSWKRVVRHNMGFKAPRGFGWFTNPKRTAYNRIYNRTTVKADGLIILGITLFVALIGGLIRGIASLFTQKQTNNTLDQSQDSTLCPSCGSSMILRNGRRGQFYGCSRFPNCRGTRDLLIIETKHE